MRIKKLLFSVIRQDAKHGIVVHVVAVDDRVPVAEVCLIAVIDEQCAAQIILAVQQAAQIIVVVPVLNDRIIDKGIFTIDPGNHILASRRQRPQNRSKQGKPSMTPLVAVLPVWGRHCSFRISIGQIVICLHAFCVFRIKFVMHLHHNKQRGEPLPSELAKLLDLEVEAIKHQGGRLEGVAPGDVGKRSVEIVGENNGMNYKKVMRYIRLNSLVPELMDMVDNKKMGFMPAVELSYIKPKNQQLIAVSIEGEQSSPSHAQAKQLRELDQAGKLNGDVIDGILSEKKKEDRGVIISMAELEKYFGKEVTPAKMKEQIMSLLDDWKEKQPPELGKADKKKTDMEK